jgi:hypothetical protein
MHTTEFDGRDYRGTWLLAAMSYIGSHRFWSLTFSILLGHRERLANDEARACIMVTQQARNRLGAAPNFLEPDYPWH